jgi:GAF domain-containing protein
MFCSATGEKGSMLLGRRLAPGQGIAGWVAEHGEPLLVHQARSDERHTSDFDKMTGFTSESILCVPLMVKGRTIGVVEALNKPEPGFTEDDLALLRSLATSAAVSIENAQLYQNLLDSRDQVSERSEALEKRLSELSRLQQMAMELGKVTVGADFHDVFRRLTEHAAALLEAESSAIMLFDPERKELICQEPAFGVPSDIVHDYHIPLDQDSPAWAAWESSEPLIINDVADAPIVEALGLKELVERMGLRSTVFSILRVGGRSIGVLQVSDKQDGSDFTRDDARVLEIFASQGAIAVENARILQRMEMLNQVGEAITAHLTLPEVLERVTQGIDALINVEGVSVWLGEPAAAANGAQLSLVASWPDQSLPSKLSDLSLELGEGIAGLVAQTGQPMIVHDAQNDPRCSRRTDQLLGFVTKSILCVPLQVRDKISGVIEVVNKAGSKFDQEDLAILSSAAASVAAAVENARLFASEQRRASEMEALVEIARAITEAVTEHPKALLEHIARGACEVLEADSAVVYPFVASQPGTYDEANAATFGTLQPLEPSRNKATTDDPTQVIRKRKLMVCEDVVCEQPTLLEDPFFEQESIQSFVGVLLEADDDELGVLYVNFRTPHRFEESELAFVRLIAHQASLAIAKSRLFQTLDQELIRANADLRRKVQELEELQAINNVISSKLEIDMVWDSILRGAMSITGAPYANVLLMDEESGEIVSHMRRGEQTFTQALDPHDTVILPPLKKTKDRLRILPDLFPNLDVHSVGGIPWHLVYWRLAPDARSVLYTPIVSGGQQKPIGLLVIGSPEDEDFDPDDRRLLEALANQAAIAIQNARYLETLRTYQEQQVEAERIAAMADIAGNLVHNINNAVGAIRPLTQQIEMKLDLGNLSDDYLYEKLQRVRESADRTLEVARQIRRPFRPLQVEPIDVNESIASAWAELTPPVGVKVDIKYGTDLPRVMATRQLDEVFGNLMRNALDAMVKQGGILSVRSRQIDNRVVIVTVTDTGTGIPLQIQEKLFHMGTTTKRGGMGYGLWWSRTFLRRLGGDITLESEEGKGCTFTVTLPINTEEEEEEVVVL